MAGQPQAEVLPEGYVVEGPHGWFLGRSKKWVRHHGRLERAYVLPIESLLDTKEMWRNRAKRVYLARYNPNLKYTEILVGTPIRFALLIVDVNFRPPIQSETERVARIIQEWGSRPGGVS
jgi:hypothetical protein